MTVTTIELSQSLVRLAERFTAARRRSGESLLEAAGYLAQAREQARHGEWLPWLAATGTTPDTAEQLLNIHERALFDRRFADAVASNWLSMTTAALLARPSVPQAVIDQALNADKSPTQREIQAAVKVANTDAHRYLEDEDDEPLTPYEEAMAAQYEQRYAPAVEYVPAPPAMPQPMQVLTSQGTVEWYTPPAIIELARRCLGGIDLDPASNTTAQDWIKAAEFYTQDDNGLVLPWFGRVWLNPPFDDTPAWVDRLDSEYLSGQVQAAILLVNSTPGYNWWEELWRRRPVCMLRERLCFVQSTGESAGQAKKGQTVAYYGADVVRFMATFQHLGRIILPEE